MKLNTQKRINANSFAALNRWKNKKAKDVRQDAIRIAKHAEDLSNARVFVPGPVVKVTPLSPTLLPEPDWKNPNSKNWRGPIENVEQAKQELAQFEQFLTSTNQLGVSNE